MRWGKKGERNEYETESPSIKSGDEMPANVFLKTNQGNERAASNHHTETIIANQVKVSL